jgi:hypothetical protein
MLSLPLLSCHTPAPLTNVQLGTDSKHLKLQLHLPSACFAHACHLPLGVWRQYPAATDDAEGSPRIRPYLVTSGNPGRAVAIQ